MATLRFVFDEGHVSVSTVVTIMHSNLDKASSAATRLLNWRVFNATIAHPALCSMHIKACKVAPLY